MEAKDEQSLPQDEAIVFPTPHPEQDNHHHNEEAFLITPSPNNKAFLITPSPNNNIVHNEHANNANKNKKYVFGKNEKDYLKSFPPGYRFCPHDDELVVQYLKKKVMNEPLPPNNIKDVDLYLHNPEQLTEKYQGQGEKEWYFFTPRNRKYRNGTRPNRAAGGGYWKATGADRPVKHEGVLVGLRKALVFYEGKPPNGGKTSWIMHEYRVDEPPRNKRNPNDMKLDEWVLCRVYKKADNKFAKVHKQDEERGNSNPLMADEEEEDTLVLPNHENDMEQEYDHNIGDSDELLINTYGRDYIQPYFLPSNEVPFLHGSPSPLKFAKFNNNLMPAATLPFTYATINPKDDVAWSTNYLPRGGGGGGGGGGGADVWSAISNYSDQLCELSSQFFSNANFSDSLRSLEDNPSPPKTEAWKTTPHLQKPLNDNRN